MKNYHTACAFSPPPRSLFALQLITPPCSLQFDPAPRAGEPLVSRRVPDYFLVCTVCLGDVYFSSSLFIIYFLLTVMKCHDNNVHTPRQCTMIIEKRLAREPVSVVHPCASRHSKIRPRTVQLHSRSISDILSLLFLHFEIRFLFLFTSHFFLILHCFYPFFQS